MENHHCSQAKLHCGMGNATFQCYRVKIDDNSFPGPADCGHVWNSVWFRSRSPFSGGRRRKAVVHKPFQWM